jgi:hypothetical protein
MALTADRLVVIGRGHLVADLSMAELAARAPQFVGSQLARDWAERCGQACPVSAEMRMPSATPITAKATRIQRVERSDANFVHSERTTSPRR